MGGRVISCAKNMRVFTAFLLGLIVSISSASVQAEELSIAEKLTIKRLSIVADSIPSVKAEFAADCRFAYTLLGDLARNPYTDVHCKNDYDYANNTDFMADVWGLVLYREAQLQNADPMTVQGKFIKKTTRLGLVSRDRFKSGSIKPVEKQARNCRKAMASENTKVEEG